MAENGVAEDDEWDEFEDDLDDLDDLDDEQLKEYDYEIGDFSAKAFKVVANANAVQVVNPGESVRMGQAATSNLREKQRKDESTR